MPASADPNVRVAPIADNMHCALLAALATRSLLTEAALTPKPGLVDRRGRGAHTDMSLALLQQSAAVLEPFFLGMAMAACGRPLDRSLRAELAAIGQRAEASMYAATAGVNTHKGAIWLLGLLVASAGQVAPAQAEIVAERAAAIAQLPHHPRSVTPSHGDRVLRLYGARGARGEACDGFPHVLQSGLPELRRARALGHVEGVCQLSALLAIMATLQDTCVLYRGGPQASAMVQRGARQVLEAGGPGTVNGSRALEQLDRTLHAHWISPGGSADLLAATLFLDSLEQQHRSLNFGPA